MKSEIYIHVGMHRTGTTFLQDQVFPILKDVNFIRYRDFLIKLKPGKNLISNESFSICPFNWVGNDKLNVNDRFVVADRLHKCFPDAKIIVGTRKDRENWKRSIYGKYLEQYQSLPFEKFVEKYDLDTYTDFESYIKYLQDLFDDVYVCNLEDLKKDSDSYIKGICDFIGVDVPKYKNKVVSPMMKNQKYIQIITYNLCNGMIKKLLSFDRRNKKVDRRIPSPKPENLIK